MFGPHKNLNHLFDKKHAQKLHDKFELRRHHHIRMGTVGYPGSKIVLTRNLEEEICSYRKLICSNFNKLRKRAIWKDHVDGGIWFFECTTKKVDDEHTKINPHLHVVMLCPKLFPIKQVNNYLAGLSGITLGRFQISTPRDKKGRIKQCTPYDAISYCTSYMKEEQQIDGRNRQTFGILLKNK